MKRGLILAAAAALTLSACATATPFQPASQATAGYGYSEQRVENDRWIVTFSGNSVTSRQTVDAYMLYRAAQLTLKSGYDWFETVGKHTEGNSSYIGDSMGGWWDPYGPYWAPSWRFYAGGAWGPWGPGWGADWDVTKITRYEASAQIVMHHGPKPEGNTHAFDARQVIANLGPHVRLPETK